MSERLTVSFLPWLELSQEAAIGPFRFWPFRKLASQKIADHRVIEHLSKVFDTYVRPEPFPIGKGKTVPVSELTVVTDETYDFSKPLEWSALFHAKNVLAFACIDWNNEQNWCTSENFELVRLGFFPGDPNLGFTAGEIARVQSLGWLLGEITFQRPIYVNGHYSPKYDSDLLQALSFAMHNASRSEVLTILRVLDYFAQAYINSGDVRRDLRIVLMALAFETLLDLRNRSELRLKIHSLCGDPSESTQPYPIVDTRTRKLLTIETLTDKQIWADEFYKLRNRIVHGEELEDNEFLFRTQSHFQLAVLFFRICIRKRLEDISWSGYTCTDSVTLNPKGEFEFDIWGGS